MLRPSSVAVHGFVLATALAACGGLDASPSIHGSVGADDADATDSPAAEGAETQSSDALGCPAMMPDVGAACPCAYSCEFGDSPDVRCDMLMTGSHGQWTVSQAPALKGCDDVRPTTPTPTDCPSPRPRIGTPCAHENQSCDYGACSGNVNLTCLAGLWENTPIDCSLQQRGS